MQLAGAVGGEHDDRRGRGRDRAELGDAHLVGREHLEQERLELVVGPVDLVDQQHRRACCSAASTGRASRKRSSYRLFSASSTVAPPAGGLEGAQVQDLAREVPVVERLGGVDALVALQPDQRQVERLGDRLGQRGLAGAGLALEQQRPLHPQRQERDRRQRVVARGSRSSPSRAARSAADVDPVVAGVLAQGYAAAWVAQAGRVDVAPGGEVAALDQRDVVGRR